MQKPKDYDTVKVGGFTPVKLGGHHLIIKDVEETKSKAGKDMVVVRFDFAPTDSQPGYFANAFEDDIRPDKKWPFIGSKYIMTTDDEGKTRRAFKAFNTAVEESNGIEIKWGKGYAEQFKGLKVGGVFGEVENEYNGNTFMRAELRYFCDDAKTDEAEIPEPFMLKKAAAPAQPDFIPDKEIPF